MKEIYPYKTEPSMIINEKKSTQKSRLIYSEMHFEKHIVCPGTQEKKILRTAQ